MSEISAGVKENLMNLRHFLKNLLVETKICAIVVSFSLWKRYMRSFSIVEVEGGVEVVQDFNMVFLAASSHMCAHCGVCWAVWGVWWGTFWFILNRRVYGDFL